MNPETIEYIRSLKPAPHEHGRALVQKGVEIGNRFEVPLTWYGGYKNHMEFKKAYQREGKIYWCLLMGLATMEDEVAAVEKIHEFQNRTGFKLGSLLHIPSGNVALPREYRENAPKTTSFVLDDLDDWLALRRAAPIDISLNDHHLVCPNSIETTVNALKAGAVRVGSFGQFLWDYPGFNDDVKRYVAALAEPLACVLNGTTTVRAHPGDEVVVLGGGPIGLIFAMLYQAAGAHVTVSEPGEYRRKLALELGVDAAIDPKTTDLKTELHKCAPQGADIVVDAVGVMLPIAIDIARKGAQIVVFGVNQTATVNIPQYPITEKELTIRGTYITKGTFPLAVKIIENRLIPIDKLVTHRLPLEKLLDGIDLMVQGAAGKVVVEI